MGKELARRMNTPVWRLPLPILRRVPGWATFPWGVVDVLREYHLSAAWQAFAVEDTLRDGLKHGQVLLPILGTWKPLWAHILILAAYQDRLGWGFVNPAHERKELTWLSQTAFSTRWNTFGRLLICVQLNLQRPPS